MAPETVQRIEPARPEEPTEALTDAIADLVAAATKLGEALHPCTAANLADLAQAAVDQIRGETQRHTIELEEADRPLIGSWDPDRIGQVLTNLLSNAVKYSPDGGTIRVRLEDLGHFARVTVEDEGLGISPDQLSQIWNRFYRGSSASEGISGLGLGLYITNSLQNADMNAVLGGTIVIGSVFIAINLLSDVLYRMLDPRTRTR